MYWFLDAADQVLYVGKAKSLKNRVVSYTRFGLLNARLQQMVSSAVLLKHQVLESELEALLVEAELIRAHQPQYNILLKDDKTPLYIVITHEDYPRVVTARRKEIEKKTISGTILGPFPSSYKVKEVLHIARQIWSWCNGSHQLGRACFYYHLGLCPGACIGKITPAEYQAQITQLLLFLRGKKKNVLKELSTQLKLATKQEEFELARVLYDKITIIQAVTQKNYKLRPDMALPALHLSEVEESVIYLRKLLTTHLSLPKNMPLHRIEGYDVSNIQGTNPAVAMVTFLDGQSAAHEYKLFNIRSLATPNDFAMHQEALTRRQNHPEWGAPDLVVIDGGKGQLRAALKVWQWPNLIIGIAKDPDRVIIPYQENGLKYHVIKLPASHPALKLIQRIRDESHRFSKKQHIKLRTKKMIESVYA